MSNTINDQNKVKEVFTDFLEKKVIVKHPKDMQFLKRFMKLSFILILNLCMSK